MDFNHCSSNHCGSHSDVIVLNAASILLCILVYAVNELWIKQEWEWLFFKNHLNDILGGIVISAYIKICFALFRKQCDSNLLIVAVFWIGIYWEYAAPFYVMESVTDNRDILCYLFGSIFNCFIGKMERRKNMLCSKCGAEMIGNVCPKCLGQEERVDGDESKFSKIGVVLTSPAPLDDGLRKYNVLYAIAAVAGVFLGKDGGFFGIVTGVGFLLVVALFIKYILAFDKRNMILPKKKFALPIGTDTDKITGIITVPLTSMGMVVEKDTAGTPVIYHKNIKYTVLIDRDNNTFSLDHKIKMFRSKGITAYRKVVVSMGLIAYTIQQEIRKSI